MLILHTASIALNYVAFSHSAIIKARRDSHECIVQRYDTRLANGISRSEVTFITVSSLVLMLDVSCSGSRREYLNAFSRAIFAVKCGAAFPDEKKFALDETILI